MLGQDRSLRKCIDGEQCVVGHHDVDVLGIPPGGLREAVLTVRTAVRPQALPGRDTDLFPRQIGDTRVQGIPVTALRLLRPLVQPHDVPAHPREIRLVDQRLLRGLRLADLVQAQVVRAALQDREGGASAHHRFKRVSQAGEIPFDQLPLQRDRRRGHHHGGTRGLRVGERRNEVRQRFTRTGAGLHRQVPLLPHRLRHGVQHRDLAGARGTVDRGHRRPEELTGVGGERGFGHGSFPRGSMSQRGIPWRPRTGLIETAWNGLPCSLTPADRGTVP